MKRMLPMLAGVTTFLFLFNAWAAPSEVAEPNALTRAIALAFSVLTVVLPIVATWLVHRGIAVFEKKTKVNVPDSIEARLDGWIEDGIFLAAEKSYQKVKEKTEKLSGPEKLEEAVGFAFDLAQARGWVQWTKDLIRKKVEAKVGHHRANGGVPKLEDKAAE